MKWLRTLFWLEAGVQFVLGGVMIIAPNIMLKLIYVPEPTILIQAIGSIALSLALLSILAAQNKETDRLTYAASSTLSVFNFGLAIFLGIAASRGLVSWLGLIVHLPFAIIFTYTTIKLRRGTK